MESDAISPNVPATGQKSRSLLISIAYPALLIFAGIALFLANLLIWVDSTVFNTASFTKVVNNTLDDPKVQDRISQVLATEIVKTGVIQDELQKQVPSQFSFITPIVDSQLDEAIARVANTVLAADFIGGLRSQAVEQFHARLLALLEGRSTVVQAQGDQLVISLGNISDRIFDEIGITPPAAVQNALGNGDIVLLDNAKNLERASFLVRNRTVFTVGTLAVGAVGLAGGIFLAPGRRRGVLMASWTIIGVGLATVLAIFFGNVALRSAAGERVVAQELVSQLEVNLKWQTAGILVLGLCGFCLADSRVLATLQSWAGAANKRIEHFGMARALLVVGGGAAVALLLTS